VWTRRRRSSQTELRSPGGEAARLVRRARRSAKRCASGRARCRPRAAASINAYFPKRPDRHRRPSRVKVTVRCDFEDGMPIPERRSELVADMMARTGLDGPMIERLVHAVDAKVREDELLGPIFDARVADWDAHLARMC